MTTNTQVVETIELPGTLDAPKMCWTPTHTNTGMHELLAEQLAQARGTLISETERVVDSLEDACKESLHKLEVRIEQLQAENKGLKAELRTNKCNIKEPSFQLAPLVPPSTPPKIRTTVWTEDEEDKPNLLSFQSQRSSSLKRSRRSDDKDKDARHEELDDIRKSHGGHLLHGRQVFADADAMKERVRQAVMKPEYNVKNFYKTTGPSQAIATSALFDSIVLFVITLNALWIAVDSDMNTSENPLETPVLFLAVEIAFCVFFLAEVSIRFVAFKYKVNCVRDPWFVFDSVLVIMMLLESVVMRLVLVFAPIDANSSNLGSGFGVIRLVRLTKMVRMVRLLRAMPELMVLVKGIMVASRSVFFTLCLLMVVIYVFAIVFTQLRIGEGSEFHEEHFSTIPKAMSFLLLQGTLPDLTDSVNAIGRHGWVYSVIFLVFTLLSSLTVMNMLIGVLVEVVSVVSAVEKEQITMRFIKMKMLHLLRKIDQDTTDEGQIDFISREQFERIILDVEAARLVQQMGVDVVGLVDIADFIFKGADTISFAEFMDLILQLRGSNSATVKDIVDLRRYISSEVNSSIHNATDEIKRFVYLAKSNTKQEMKTLEKAMTQTQINKNRCRAALADKDRDTTPVQPVVFEWDV
mmetsp:Transcript_22990/g.52627  ORF Transcript_22990/g.52627 Transcript_22990/m.52627 type:complete len:636 (-) Transcript_22990:120-2027(-)|eukprot:CAMPEP_0197907510 /NCGR_PEP_ID=MMETSP1439-20131203/64982_1 /TAXON_ID=66791 /ORGANISM="Gonyaulax spinifera, Strain CCMP409" /LENGTH=635 /DNA_ID=CAMNT_0043528945 /DNA_START=132 /DNA_END=2039 /DNA_ORIENTATION=-